MLVDKKTAENVIKVGDAASKFERTREMRRQAERLVEEKKKGFIITSLVILRFDKVENV